MDSSEVSITTPHCSVMSSSAEPFPAFSTSHHSGLDPAMVCHKKQDPSLALSPRSPVKSKTRRKTKKSTADSSIRRLCASHQNDIGLLCDLWSSPSPSHSQFELDSHKSYSAIGSVPVLESSVSHACGESERQRLLQVEMQLMRMQLQQAELLLPPSRSASCSLLTLSRTPSVEDPKSMLPNAGSDPSECLQKSQLRLPLDDDYTHSIQIAQEEHQNLLWAEADYRAHKRGPKSCSPLDQSDSTSVSPSSVPSDFANAPLCQGHLKMPRGLFRKFWCAKKRFCMLDSSRCFFYWKSQEQRDSGRAKCLSGVTGGILLPGDDRALELSYAGGTCVVLLRCDSAAEAKRWLAALNTFDADSPHERQLDSESLGGGTSTPYQSPLVSATKSSSKPDFSRRTVAVDCNIQREVIQNVFLDEFRKEQQFEQMLRSSKSTPSTPCARENCLSSLVF